MTASAGTLRFGLRGIPVAVEPSFWLVAIVLGLARRPSLPALAVWVAVLFVSVLGHELGHAVAFRHYGHPARVRLVALGGVTEPVSPRPISHGRDIVITLAGPAVGLALGAAVLVLANQAAAGSQQLFDIALTDALWANFGLSVLNLVPILPLDGGRVLLAGLQLVTGGRGERGALVISAAAATVSVGFAAARGLWWAALFAGYLAVGNVRALLEHRRPARRPDGAAVVREGYQAFAQGATMAAANRAREAWVTQSDPEVRWAAGRLLVWTALLEGDRSAAAGRMKDLPLSHPLLDDDVVQGVGGVDAAIRLLRGAFEASPGEATLRYLLGALLEVGRLDEACGVLVMAKAAALGPDGPALVGAALFRAGRFEEAAQVGARSFADHRHHTIAYNVACCWVRQGQLGDALVWLGHAVDAGYDGDLDDDPDLAGVRALPGYERLRQRQDPDRREPPLA